MSSVKPTLGSSHSICSRSGFFPLRNGGEWRPRGGSFVRCGAEEPTGSQRIERALEATKRRAANRSTRTVSSRPLVSSLHERIRQNQWLPALRIFELLREQPWYIANTSTYLKLFTLLATARQPEEASRLFTAMLEDNVQPTTAIFTALLTVYTKTNHFKKAMAAFESMRLYKGCVPDKYTYTAMIKGCCEAELYVQAQKLFDEMLMEGVKPTVVTYNTLIFGYGKTGMFREIERVLQTMEFNRVKPDTVTWNTLIRVFGLHNKISHMEHAYESLLASRLKPDFITLNILISAYGTAGLLEKMESVIAYMERYNFNMTAATYNTILEFYGKAGKIEEMEKVFRKMEVRPNRGTFCAVLNAYGQHGRWHRVDEVLEEAEEYGAVSTGLWNAAIDAYQRAQNFEDMEVAFERMKRQGFVPDDVTYSILIAAYKRVMRLAKAEQLQLEWDASKKPPSD